MRKLITAFLLLISWFLSSQHTGDLSAELQIYPTGIIPGISYDHHIGASSALTFRLGANIFDHRDLGVQDEEEGSGFGGSVGYRKYFSDSRASWNWGIRTDVWFSDVEWANVGTQGGSEIGETSITVIQPTASLGYTFLTDGGFFISPAISFGFEWNVRTVGEPTGEGSIILIGIQAGKRF